MPNGPRKLPKPQTLTVADPGAPLPPPGPAARRRARLTRLAERAAGPDSDMEQPTEEELAAQGARARAEARAAEARAVIARLGRNLGGSIRRRNRRNRKTRRRHK